MQTLVQQISATEALAAVDTICVDKTGTLTDGTLSLAGIEFADPEHPQSTEQALGRFAHSVGERNRTLQAIAERYVSSPVAVSAEVPFSSAWKWSGATLGPNGSSRTFVMGAPDILLRAGVLELPPALAAKLAEHTSVGRRVVAFAEARGALPDDPAHQAPPPLDARALVVLSEQLRPDAIETVELHARAAGRPEADLRRCARDRDRGGPRCRRAGRRGRHRGARPAGRRPRPGLGGRGEHGVLPDHAGAEAGAGERAGRPRAVHQR